LEVFILRSREIKRRQGLGRKNSGIFVILAKKAKNLPRFRVPLAVRRSGVNASTFIRASTGRSRRPTHGMAIDLRKVKELFFRTCVIATIFLLLVIGWRAIRPGTRVRVNPETVAAFRIPHRAIGMLKNYADAHNISFPELFAVFNAENGFFPEKSATYDLSNLEEMYLENFSRILRRYNNRSLRPYVEMYKNLFNEIEVFPIPSGWYDYDASIMFGNSWGVEHNFQGNRMHMGTGIIDRENIRGRVPVVSMTAGQVTDAGWDNQLGYFVGITTQSGGYFLYAHLDSIAPLLAAGQSVAPGQLLGQMGNSGGGRNSRSFQVHLHLAISPNVSFTRRDFWINPYPLLRYLESKHFY